MTKCKKHPQYKAIYKPRVDCKQCWNMYLDTVKFTFNGEEYEVKLNLPDSIKNLLKSIHNDRNKR